MKTVTAERDANELNRTVTLGTVRLQNEVTHETILIPTPSDDPNDPLNWSSKFRYYIAGVVCMAVFMCNFLAAGPSVAIVPITIDFFGPPGRTFPAHIAKVAYFFTTTALMQGMSNLFWMPAILKYGRRPVYLTSFTAYTVCAIWAGVAKSYSNELAARIIMGLACGAGECVAPITIADIFFLHERGTVMATYTAFLSCGVSAGIIISGLITITHDWRYIYYVATALIGAATLLVFFTMPETSYNRSPVPTPSALSNTSRLYTSNGDSTEKSGGITHVEAGHATPPTTTTTNSTNDTTTTTTNHNNTMTPHRQVKHSYGRRLRLYNGVLTRESVFKIFLRPIILLMVPPVLWATLVMSVTIGFVVAISSNFAAAFAETYQFAPWQSGLCFIAGIIGALIGIFAGGYLSDLTANYLTARNGGIREPEMRLPAMTIGLLAAPLSLVLYGVGIDKHLHWIVPTLGLGFLNFAIAQATNVSLVYTIDAYRPVAGEVIVSQLGFKSAFGFLLSFYTNPWIAKDGYSRAFGAMAGISAAVLVLWVPFYLYGKRIREASLSWPLVKNVVRWDLDREVGE